MFGVCWADTVICTVCSLLKLSARLSQTYNNNAIVFVWNILLLVFFYHNHVVCSLVSNCSTQFAYYLHKCLNNKNFNSFFAKQLFSAILRCKCVRVLRLWTKWITRESFAATLWAEITRKSLTYPVFCCDFAIFFPICVSLLLCELHYLQTTHAHRNTLCVSLSLCARKENNTHFYCIKWYI